MVDHTEIRFYAVRAGGRRSVRGPLDLDETFRADGLHGQVSKSSSSGIVRRRRRT